MKQDVMVNQNRLVDRTALITGGARGIGAGIAQCMAREGADVALIDRANDDQAAQVVQQIEALGRRALFVKTDVADRDAMVSMYAMVIAHFGRLDIAVANAAISVRQPVIEADWESVRRTLEVAQFGVFHTLQMAAQQMVKQGPRADATRNGGKIIVISSIHEEWPVPNSAAYNMAKAAVNHLVRTMAVELAGARINVNVINPGWIDTPGERAFFSEAELHEGGQRLPWGRIGTPDDIGKAAVFLASDEADYITGSMLRVDGGMFVART